MLTLSTPSPRPAEDGTARIDRLMPGYDVTNTLVVATGAAPERVRSALERIDLAAVARRSTTLVAPGALAVAPTVLATGPGPEIVLGAAWRVADAAAPPARAWPDALRLPGHVALAWDVRAEPDGLGGSWLSSTRRFTGSDAPARAALLDAWGALAPLAEALAQRTLRHVRAAALDQRGSRSGRSSSRRASGRPTTLR